MSTICLAMIVKDEAAVIGRCLASVRPHITRWVVCDTGSSDATRDMVLDALAGIPGELHQDVWRDFGSNRTLSIERARRSGADYILVIDADEELVVDEPDVLDRLCHDGYVLREHNAGLSWLTLRLVRASLSWRYSGSIHEELECGEGALRAILEGVHITTRQDGARSMDPAKVDKDIATMEAALEQDPSDAYRWFHLGLAARMQGRIAYAINCLEKRLHLDPLDTPECWQARYHLGQLYAASGKHESVAPLLLGAFADFPLSIEPLYRLGRYYLAIQRPEQAFPYLLLAADADKPPLAFLREDSVYDWEARLYLAVCELQMGRYEDAQIILNDMVHSGTLPAGALEAAGVHAEPYTLAQEALVHG